jgi:hypothetical protein
MLQSILMEMSYRDRMSKPEMEYSKSSGIGCEEGKSKHYCELP